MPAGNASARLVLRSRPESLPVLREFIRRWGTDRGLSLGRQERLEQAAAGVFQHLVGEGYGAERHGAIAVCLEDRHPQLRLVFEDDAPPFNPAGFRGLSLVTVPGGGTPGDGAASPLADSLIYYRTEDHKNRVVLVVSR